MLEQDIRWINDNTFSGQTHVEIYFISNYRNNKSNGKHEIAKTTCSTR